MRGDRLFITVMLGPALIILALFYLWPMVENLRVSFTDLTLLRLRVGGQWIGLALVERGRERFGEIARAHDPVRGEDYDVEICNPVFYDPEGGRQRG